jgi:hypothetical protein
MTIIVLLLLILTFAPRQDVGAPAVLRAWRRMNDDADGTLTRRWQHAMFGLMALTFLAVHVAHDAQSPQAALMAGAQDEMAWVARHAAPEAAATARLDAPTILESESE